MCLIALLTVIEVYAQFSSRLGFIFHKQSVQLDKSFMEISKRV